jgi:hypothetical protein
MAGIAGFGDDDDALTRVNVLHYITVADGYLESDPGDASGSSTAANYWSDPFELGANALTNPDVTLTISGLTAGAAVALGTVTPSSTVAVSAPTAATATLAPRRLPFRSRSPDSQRAPQLHSALLRRPARFLLLV